MAEKHPGDDTSQRIEDSLVRLKGALYGVELTQRFSKDSVKNFKSYCKEFVKNVKPTGFVEPQMEMPTRASVRLRESLNAVLRSGAKSMIQMPTNSNEPKVPSSNNTLVISPVSTSGRAPRRAAMKARAGCFSAFHLPQKLRRPTNFDPKSGVLLPTIPQTPEVARKILDREIGDQDDVAGSGIVAGPSSAHDAKSGSCKRSFDEVFKIPELPVAEPKKKAERASRSRSRRLNASQAASTDPAMELAAEICRSKRVTRSRSTRSRRQEETTTEDDESEDTNPRHVEPHSRSTRARSKMLKVPDAQQQMSEPSSSTFLVEREQPMEVANDFYEEGAMTIAPPKTRNTYRVSGVDTNKQSNDEATDDLLSRTFRVNAATNKPKASKKVIKEKCRSESASPGPSRRSRSVPDMFGSNSAIDEIHHVLKKRPSNVDDPTENFDPWAELSDTDPNRGLKRPSDQGPVIKSKRSKTEDPSVGGVEGMVFEVELQAAPPRTRSKHRAQTKNAHDGAHSAFLGLKGIVNKENDRLAIGQMMKAMERPGRLTPSKTSKLAKNKRVEVLKKTEEDPSKKKKDMLSQKTEDLKQKREMKERKAAELRAAAEREKQLQLEKEQKEREEREKQARAEKQKQKEEALMKKKLLNMQKAQEAEERRRKEEELRLARLKEQEEEQRRAAEARMKQVEDAERLAALRKAQEKEEEAMRLQQEKMKEKERLNAAKMAQKSKEHVDPDDIGIADEDAEESDGKPPRCPTPKWAEKEDRTKQLKLQAFLASEAIFDFFDIKNETPDLREIFGSGALLRPRTSSAVWPTTPPPPASSR